MEFKPGLVGRHGIGVDPYYLTHKALALGYLPEVILAGHRLNDGIGKCVATGVVKLMVRKGQKGGNAEVLILGMFKEICPAIRNSHAVDAGRGLEEFSCQVAIFEPWADPAEVKHEYGLSSVRELGFLKSRRLRCPRAGSGAPRIHNTEFPTL